jgi:uncharacterized membrane protein YgaE (UPF0421/DUF939 family)
MPAFFSNSALFYYQHRGSWAIVIVILCLSPTTGGSLYSTAVQALGAILGGVLAMAVWYMVDGKVGGVIVFTFIVTMCRKLLYC